MALDFNFNVVPPPGGGGGTLTLTPSIVARAPSQCFPECIHLDVSVSGQDTSGTVGSNGYDARLHDIEYLWDGYFVGSANAYTFTAPVGIYDGTARHANGHKNSRYQYAPKASFTYRVAGTYTVRVYAYEPSSGKFGSADITFTVGSQDNAYPGAQTIYADPSGTFVNSPVGCVQTTESNLSTLISTYIYGTVSRRRILLARGQSYTISTQSNLGAASNSYRGLRIDARGTGANPDIVYSSPVNFIRFDNTGGTLDTEFVMANCDLTATYSDQTTSAEGSQIAGFPGNPTGLEYILLDAVVVRKVNSHMSAGTAGANAPRYIAFNDVDMEERAYGCIRYGGAWHSFVGFRCHSTPLALIDSTPGNGWADRIQGRVLLYHSCDYFTRQGGNPIGAYKTPQASIRANYDQLYTTKGDEYYFCASKFENPGWLSNFQFIDAEGGAEKPCNIVISKTLIIGGWACQGLIECGTGGLTVRSCVGYHPNCVSKLGNEFQFMVRLTGTNPGGDPDNLSTPIKIYSNTFINDLDGNINRFGFTGQVAINNNVAGFTNISSGTGNNNIIYNTRTIPPDTSQGPIARVADEFTIVDGGYIDSTQNLSSTVVKNTAEGELDYPELLTGSPSIGAASTGLVHDSDFFGVRIVDALSGLGRATPSKGGLESATLES